MKHHHEFLLPLFAAMAAAVAVVDAVAATTATMKKKLPFERRKLDESKFIEDRLSKEIFAKYEMSLQKESVKVTNNNPLPTKSHPLHLSKGSTSTSYHPSQSGDEDGDGSNRRSLMKQRRELLETLQHQLGSATTQGSADTGASDNGLRGGVTDDYSVAGSKGGDVERILQTGCDAEPFGSAIPIDFDPYGVVYTVGSTVGAITPSIPTQFGCRVELNSPTVWYTFTTTTARSFGLTTCHPATANFDTVITVYSVVENDSDEDTEETEDSEDEDSEGPTCNLDCLEQNNDHRSTVGFCQTNSQHSLVVVESDEPATYYIAVSGFAAAAEGSFVLVSIGLDDPPPIVHGLSTNFVCDRLFGFDDFMYTGRSLCRYQEPIYEQYNNLFGCYCHDRDAVLANNIQSTSDDCECVMIFWSDDDATIRGDFHLCRSASIIAPTPTTSTSSTNTTAFDPNLFQLQYDCSNVFELVDDEEPCVGRDENGLCFDVDSVPSPISHGPIIFGRWDELTCLEEPLSAEEDEDGEFVLPEFYAGKYQCNSPLSPPPGFPFPRTDAFVGLLCDTPEPSEECNCFVSVTHLPDISNHCTACEIIASTNATYQISFDCTNFYNRGDCVSVDENGGCLGGKNCQGEGVVDLDCSELFERETCIIEDDDDDSGSFIFSGADPCDSDCFEDCGFVNGCGCRYGFSISFPFGTTGIAECLGTANVVCSHLVTEDSCEDHEDFDCEWVPNDSGEDSEEEETESDDEDD